jgi:replication factor C small subunit
MESWIEKWRPKKLKDFAGQRQVIEIIKPMIKKKNIPNSIILAGPVGTGKTSLAFIIVKEVLVERNWNFVRYGPSDVGGAEFVRTKVREFARCKPFRDGFRIIFLDAAEKISSDAQFELQWIIEEYGKITKFILTVNNLDKMIEQIKSRSLILNFQPHNDDTIFTRLKLIANHEGLEVGKETLKAIAVTAKGDMRKAINELEFVAKGKRCVK